jgi:hypothetical protein
MLIVLSLVFIFQKYTQSYTMNANHFRHNLMRNVHVDFSQMRSFGALAEMGSFTENEFQSVKSDSV